MKNLAIIIAIAILAFLIYQFALKDQGKDQRAPATTVVETPAVEATTTTETPVQSAPVTESSLVSKSSDGADVFILEPGNGATVSSPVTVKFGITNMTVAKAGDNQPNSGHHHLLIDLEELPNLNAPLPTTDQILHFGGGETETVIELEPGQHTLQLLLGNYLHIPHDTPVLSKKITITVE